MREQEKVAFMLGEVRDTLRKVEVLLAALAAPQPEPPVSDLLLRCHHAIRTAVYGEEGLQGDVGEDLLFDIQAALPAPLPKIEHDPDEECPHAGPHHPSECGHGIWALPEPEPPAAEVDEPEVIVRLNLPVAPEPGREDAEEIARSFLTKAWDGALNDMPDDAFRKLVGDLTARLRSPAPQQREERLARLPAEPCGCDRGPAYMEHPTEPGADVCEACWRELRALPAPAPTQREDAGQSTAWCTDEQAAEWGWIKPDVPAPEAQTEPLTEWTCPNARCGTVNYAAFCTECGEARPAPSEGTEAGGEHA